MPSSCRTGPVRRDCLLCLLDQLKPPTNRQSCPLLPLEAAESEPSLTVSLVNPFPSDGKYTFLQVVGNDRQTRIPRWAGW